MTLLDQRARLRQCYEDDLLTAAPDFRAALSTKLKAANALVQTGQLPASTAANAHAVSWSAPEKTDVTPMSLVRLWEAMIELFDDFKANLGAAGTDDVIFANMMQYLATPVRVLNDYSALRAA